MKAFEERTVTDLINLMRFTRPASAYETFPRPFSVISYRVRGSCTFFSRGETVHVRTGELLYIPASVPYSQRSDEDEEIIALQYLSDGEEGDTLRRLTPADPAFAASLLKEMLTTWYMRGTGARARLFSLIYTLFGALGEPLPQGIMVAERMMCSRFSDPDLTIARVAEETNMSESGFRRAFASVFGVSPKKYLTRLRLTHAEALLHLGYCTVEKAAHDSGFADPKYFHRVWRQTYGTTPASAKPLISASHCVLKPDREEE